MWRLWVTAPSAARAPHARPGGLPRGPPTTPPTRPPAAGLRARAPRRRGRRGRAFGAVVARTAAASRWSGAPCAAPLASLVVRTPVFVARCMPRTFARAPAASSLLVARALCAGVLCLRWSWLLAGLVDGLPPGDPRLPSWVRGGRGRRRVCLTFPRPRPRAARGSRWSSPSSALVARDGHWLYVVRSAPSIVLWSGALETSRRWSPLTALGGARLASRRPTCGTATKATRASREAPDLAVA